MNSISSLFKALLFYGLASFAQAQTEKEKEEFEKIAERGRFVETLGAYDNLVYIRIRLNSLPVSGEPFIDMQGNAVAAALARPFEETDPSCQLWRIYFREVPALVAAAGKDNLPQLKNSYKKLLQKKKPVPDSLTESWLVDLRMIFTNSQSEALLNDPVRRNYATLLVFGAYLATAGDSNDAKFQRAMLKAAVKSVHGRMSPGVSKPTEELTQRVGVMAEVMGAKSDTWEDFLKWFESAAR